MKNVLVDNYFQSQNKPKEGQEQIPNSSPQKKMQAPAIQNGLSKKIQKAKSGTVGFGAGFAGNSTSPLKLHSKQNSEAVAQACNKGDAHGPDLNRLSSGETSASGKNTIKSRTPMMKSVSANEKVQDDELKNLNHVSAKKSDT